MSLIDRLGNVVRSEWNDRFGEEPNERDDAPDDADADADEEPSAKRRGKPRASSAARRPAARRAPQVDDVASAWRVLEVREGATLDEVRESYFALARRYHPRTLSKVADKAYAAQTVLDALTDALELLEAHLLPLPDGRRG
jgi:hypothetical protein